MRSALIASIATAAALGAATGAQQSAAPTAATPQPAVTFRSDVNFVEINAVVTDDRGEAVAGLTKDDFEVLEDGKPQAPTVFAFVDMPAAPASQVADTVEPDVRSTRRGFDGRLYVLVLDDLHTLAQRSPVVREATRRFIREHLAPGDLAALVHTSGRTDAAQELTSSRRLLTEAADKFLGQKLPSAAAERLAMHALENPTGDQDNTSNRSPTDPPINDPLDLERGMTARRALELIGSVAGWMTDIHGRRKALVLFSEGIDIDIYDVFNSRSASSVMQEARDAIASAQRAGVSIYAIDPRGLAGARDDATASASTAADHTIREISPGAFRQELLLSQESLMSMADETGGVAAVNTNDIAGALARVARESSTYYLLGYHSDSTRSPGRFRKIEVRVKRPGLRVRARRGYVPPDARSLKARETSVETGTSAGLRAAMLSPVPVGEVPLRLFAAPFKGTGRDASVLVALEIDGPGLKFDARDNLMTGKIELSVAAIDRQGRVRDSHHQAFDMKFNADLHRLITNQGGIRILSRLTLPPSRYQIRVGIYDSVGGRAGALPYDLEVPDYSKVPFTLSGLLLAASRPAGIVTMKPDELLKEILPLPPVAIREFHPQDTVTLLAELYDNSSRSAHTVDFVTRVRRAETSERVFESSATRSVSGGNWREWYTVAIPAKEFRPGRYVLSVEARSREGNHTAAREVPFEVSLTPRGIAAN